MANYTFRFRCSYLNSTYFQVYGDGPDYEIELRRGVSDYERSIFNGGNVEWNRDIVPLVGCVIRMCGDPIPAAVVEAFNAWRLAEYLEHRAQIDAQPERYGVVDWDIDPVFAKPMPARGARSVTTPIPDRKPGEYPCSVWHGWMIEGDNVLAHLKA